MYIHDIHNMQRDCVLNREWSKQKKNVCGGGLTAAIILQGTGIVRKQQLILVPFHVYDQVHCLCALGLGVQFHRIEGGNNRLVRLPPGSGAKLDFYSGFLVYGIWYMWGTKIFFFFFFFLHVYKRYT